MSIIPQRRRKLGLRKHVAAPFAPPAAFEAVPVLIEASRIRAFACVNNELVKLQWQVCSIQHRSIPRAKETNHEL